MLPGSSLIPPWLTSVKLVWPLWPRGRAKNFSFELKLETIFIVLISTQSAVILTLSVSLEAGKVLNKDISHLVTQSMPKHCSRAK